MIFAKVLTRVKKSNVKCAFVIWYKGISFVSRTWYLAVAVLAVLHLRLLRYSPQHILLIVQTTALRHSDFSFFLFLLFFLMFFSALYLVHLSILFYSSFCSLFCFLPLCLFTLFSAIFSLLFSFPVTLFCLLLLMYYYNSICSLFVRALYSVWYFLLSFSLLLLFCLYSFFLVRS